MPYGCSQPEGPPTSPTRLCEEMQRTCLLARHWEVDQRLICLIYSASTSPVFSKRMHSHSKSQPLAKLLFGTVWKDFWPAFRMPFLSPLCLFSLHPTSCEVSDSFSFVSSIWQDVLEKKDKRSNRTYPFQSQRRQRETNSICSLLCPLYICE